jgi:hypothetical protein
MYGPDAVKILSDIGMRRIAERVCRELDIGTKEDIAALTNEQIDALHILDWQQEKLKRFRNCVRDIGLYREDTEQANDWQYRPDKQPEQQHREATQKVKDWRAGVRPPRVSPEYSTNLKDKVRREAARPTKQEEKHRHDTYEEWQSNLHGLRSLLAKLQSPSTHTESQPVRESLFF